MEAARDMLNIPRSRAASESSKVSFSMEKAVLRLVRTGRVIWNAALSLQRVVLVAGGVFLAGLVVAEVIFRYFLEIPLMWVEELSLYCVFWFYLAGGALATYKRSHIKGGIVDRVLGNNPRLLGYFQVATVCICLALSCLIAVWGYNFFTWSLEQTPTPRTIHLSLPLPYARLSLTVGYALLSLYFLVELIDSVRGVVCRWRIVNSAAADRQ